MRDGLGRAEANVRGEHFARLQIDRGADAADEKAHARERGDGNGEREQQHAQLAGTPFAPERSQRESGRRRARRSFDEASGLHPQDAAARRRQ